MSDALNVIVSSVFDVKKTIFEILINLRSPLFPQYEYPKWFYNRQFDQYNDLLNYNAKYMLAGRDKKGRRIYLTRICKSKKLCSTRAIRLLIKKFINFTTAQISKLSPVELAQLDDMWLETMLNEKETVNNGIIALIDMSG